MKYSRNFLWELKLEEIPIETMVLLSVIERLVSRKFGAAKEWFNASLAKQEH